MNVPMRTSYEQAIRLFDHCGAALAYALLVAAALLAPAVLGEYVLAQLSFVAIYAIAGVGMMLLMGYAGQISLGHAAFLAVGSCSSPLPRVGCRTGAEHTPARGDTRVTSPRRPQASSCPHASTATMPSSSTLTRTSIGRQQTWQSSM